MRTPVYLNNAREQGSNPKPIEFWDLTFITKPIDVWLMLEIIDEYKRGTFLKGLSNFF